MKNDQYMPPDDKRALLISWIRRARESQFSHYEMANIYAGREKKLGIPVIIINAIVGTAAFAAISAEVIGTHEKIAVGLLSIIASVLASLQTFFNYNEKSERHRAAGAKYGIVRRKIEDIYTDNTSSYGGEKINNACKDLDRLAEDSPAVPASVFNRVKDNIYEADGSEHKVGSRNLTEGGTTVAPTKT